MFEVTPSEFDGWYRVSVNTTLVDDFLATEDMFDDKQMINDLLATPHLLFTNTASLQPESRLFRTISPEVYAGADAVHIACANFTATRQYQIWSRLYGVVFDVNQPFKRYVTPNLTVHYAEQTYNSKTFNGRNSTIRQRVIDHIEQRCTDPVYVDNNCHDDRRGWQRVDHNCHGVNQYRHVQHIAFLSAINYSNLDSAFLQDVVSMDKDEIRHSLVGEMAHQVLMRGALREKNDAVCHVYVMEAALAAYLLTAIFSSAQECVISDTHRPQKKPPIKGSDRKKACHLRRRLSQYKDMSTRELMNDPIWHLTGSNGQDIKPSKLLMTDIAESAQA